MHSSKHIADKCHVNCSIRLLPGNFYYGCRSPPPRNFATPILSNLQCVPSYGPYATPSPPLRQTPLQLNHLPYSSQHPSFLLHPTPPQRVSPHSRFLRNTKSHHHGSLSRYLDNGSQTPQLARSTPLAKPRAEFPLHEPRTLVTRLA